LATRAQLLAEYPHLKDIVTALTADES
jgi:hypothetical protein